MLSQRQVWSSRPGSHRLPAYFGRLPEMIGHARRLPDHDTGTRRKMCELVRDASEKHALEIAQTATADKQHIGACVFDDFDDLLSNISLGYA